MTKSIPKTIRELDILLKRNIDSQIKNDDLTRIQGWIIGYIFDNKDKDIFQKDIEKELNLRRSTVSEIIDCMVSKEYLYRESVYYDQRLKKIVLTEKAINHQYKFMNFIKDFETKVSEGFSKEELDMFFEMIERIKANIK